MVDGGISKEVLLSELKGAQAVLAAWVSKLEAGVPGIDYPVDGMTPPADQPEVLFQRLVGELALVSGKCDTLIRVMTGQHT